MNPLQTFLTLADGRLHPFTLAPNVPQVVSCVIDGVTHTVTLTHITQEDLVHIRKCESSTDSDGPHETESILLVPVYQARRCADSGTCLYPHAIPLEILDSLNNPFETTS